MLKDCLVWVWLMPLEKLPISFYVRSSQSKWLELKSVLKTLLLFSMATPRQLRLNCLTGGIQLQKHSRKSSIPAGKTNLTWCLSFVWWVSLTMDWNFALQIHLRKKRICSIGHISSSQYITQNIFLHRSNKNFLLFIDTTTNTCRKVTN